MISEERIDYARYRIESAHRTFDAAKILAENGYWNSAVNRLYYAAFYAINALLFVNEIQTNTDYLQADKALAAQLESSPKIQLASGFPYGWWKGSKSVSC